MRTSRDILPRSDMSSRMLMRWILLAQALTALALAAAAMYWLGLSPWPALGAGLAGVVLVRLAINANNFWMSSRSGSPTPPAWRLGPGAALRMFAEEFGASMLSSSWLMARARAHTRIHPDAAGLPVLLIHGYGCNSGYWAHLVKRLDAARISHATLDLEPLTGDIDGYAAAIEQGVRALLARSGAARLVIVGHSMGGLAARAWMRVHAGAGGADRVARLVTLGTPHHGTCLAVFGLGINAGQMRRMGVAGPECAWLQALGAGEEAHMRSRITSIFTHHDNIVAPQTSSHLPGARNLAFGGVGHVALGRNRRVLDAVMNEIAAASAAAATQESSTAALHHRS